MATGGSAGSYYHNTMGNIHYPIPTGYNTYGYQPIVVQPAVAQPVATPVVKYTKPVAAPVVKPSAYTEYNDESSFGFTDLFSFGNLQSLNSIMQYVNNPNAALAKATTALDDLNKGLPDLLARMDPSMKDDIKKVNELVLDICDRAVSGARPATDFSSYYSPESIKATCDFIKENVPQISRGLDDPAVITNLIEELKEVSSLSQEFSDIFK